MDQNPNIIATKGPKPEIHVFDHSKHEPKPEDCGDCLPELRLTGHTKEGYAFVASRLHWIASPSYKLPSCACNFQARVHKTCSTAEFTFIFVYTPPLMELYTLPLMALSTPPLLELYTPPFMALYTPSLNGIMHPAI